MNYKFQMGFSDLDSDNKPQSFQQTYEHKRQLLRMELQQKEDEMRQQFVIRVKEKETELKEAEKEVIFSNAILVIQIQLTLFVSICSFNLVSIGSKKSTLKRRGNWMKPKNDWKIIRTSSLSDANSC